MKKRTSRTFANMKSGLKRPKLYGLTNRAPSFSILNTAKTRTGTFGSAIPAFTRLLLVVFCERAGGGVIRVISARQASTKERWQYEEGI